MGAFLWDAKPAASTMISLLLCLGQRIEKFRLVLPRSTHQPQGSPWPAETSGCLRSSIPAGSWGCSSVVSAGLACVRRGGFAESLDLQRKMSTGVLDWPQGSGAKEPAHSQMLGSVL